MKRTITIVTILALAGCILAGCSSSDSSSTEAAKEEKVTEPSSQTEETSESTSETTEAPAPSHKVEVTDQSVTVLTDDEGQEYKTIIPKIIVDGKEADAINAALSDFINENYRLEKVEVSDDDYTTCYVDGMTTRYAWGVRGDIISVIIISSETFTDGVGYDIFNYNADTLQPAGNDEVISSFGMTEDEFNSKVADAYRVFWESQTWLKDDKAGLDNSINGISSGSVTPFVTPDGNIGAEGTIYISDSQFPEQIKCFDLDALTVEYFA